MERGGDGVGYSLWGWIFFGSVLVRGKRREGGGGGGGEERELFGPYLLRKWVGGDQQIPLCSWIYEAGWAFVVFGSQWLSIECTCMGVWLVGWLVRKKIPNLIYFRSLYH